MPGKSQGILRWMISGNPVMIGTGVMAPAEHEKLQIFGFCSIIYFQIKVSF